MSSRTLKSVVKRIPEYMNKKSILAVIKNELERTWIQPEKHIELIKKTLGGYFRRLDTNPIITPNMPGLEGEIGLNINGPSLIKVPDWVNNPLGKYYLYFGHHNDKYIRLAYSDKIGGPYSIYKKGSLHVGDTSIEGHIASPDVHINHVEKEIWMYFHGSVKGAGIYSDQSQTSFLAISGNGVNFRAQIGQYRQRHILAPFYLRVFKHKDYYYGIAKNGNRNGILVRSKNGKTQFERGNELIDGMRHCAVLLRKMPEENDVLWVFYSCVNLKPERILFSEIVLNGDWMDWKPTEPITVLFPEKKWEGSELRAKVSKYGATGPTRALRDPAIYVEDDKVFLLYSIKGEQGIGIAEFIRN